MDKERKIYHLFLKEPGQWGLRGDPFLWEDMKNKFKETILPDNKDDLKNIIESKFKEITEFDISTDDHIFIEAYDKGGMSSGYVDPGTWRNRLIPYLLERYDLIVEVPTYYL